jgi:hypothetical protein
MLLLPAAAVRRLRAHTSGNPLHARALLEQVSAEALADLDAPLPAPRSFALLVLGQVASCDDHTRRLVEAASVLGVSCALHEAAEMAELAESLLPLERAVQAGLLGEQRCAVGLVIRFPHPLIQAAVYDNLGPATRARLHLRAAELFDDDYRRLHHRFRAADRPDPQLAAELAAYGRDQAAAGYWAGAAIHLNRGARLTTVEEERARWTGEAVLAALYAGQTGEASTLAQALSSATDEALRAFCVGVVALIAGRGVEASQHLEHAWQRCDPVTDPALAGWIATQLASLSVIQGHGRDAVMWAKRAVQMPVRRAHGDLLDFLLFTGLANAGEIGQALALGAGLPELPEAGIAGLDPLLGRGAVRMWSDDLHGALHDLTSVVAASTRLSMPFRVTATSLLGATEYRMGRWEDAIVHTELAASIGDDADQIFLASCAHAEAAFVPAARGEWESAAAHVRAAHQAMGPYPSVAAHTYTAAASAELATARADPQGVVSALKPLLDLEGRDGVFEPGIILPWQALPTRSSTSASLNRRNRCSTGARFSPPTADATPNWPPRREPVGTSTPPAANPIAPTPHTGPAWNTPHRSTCPSPMPGCVFPMGPSCADRVNAAPRYSSSTPRGRPLPGSVPGPTLNAAIKNSRPAAVHRPRFVTCQVTGSRRKNTP